MLTWSYINISLLLGTFVFYHMATIRFDKDTTGLQVEAAVSEREKLLLVKISELQARSVHCGHQVNCGAIFSQFYVEFLMKELIFSLLCRMINLTDELTAEKLKYWQVSAYLFL